MLRTFWSLETVQILRRLILGLMLLGIMATLLELLLIGHTKDVMQWIPFLVLALAAGGIALITFAPSQRNLRLFQTLMVLVALSCLIGIYKHFTGNLEFQLEVHPDLKGWALLWKTLTGGVPLLAPGILLQVGLLGLLYSFRYPLTSSEKNLSKLEVVNARPY